MKLAYLSLARIPSEKAHAGQIMRFCSALAAAGSEATLLVPARWVQSKEIKAQGSRDAFSYYDIQPFPIRRFPCIDLLDFQFPLFQELVAYPLYCLSFSFFAAFSFLFGARSQVYYVRDYPLACLLRLLTFFRPQRVVFEVHALPPRSFFSRLALSKCFSYVTLTQAASERLSSGFGIPPGKILVAPDAVDAKLLSFPETSEASRASLGLPRGKLIGYVGRFHTLGMEKGLCSLLEAFRLLQRDQPNTWLCLVGGPSDMLAAYRSHAVQLGIADKVLLFDYVSPAKATRFINSFDVCVLPFPWTEHFAYYASALKLFEYMALGKPIVATDLPSHLEILQDGKTAVLVPPSDPEALARGILRVLEDLAFAKKIGELARSKARQNYTWERRAKRVLAFLS